MHTEGTDGIYSYKVRSSVFQSEPSRPNSKHSMPYHHRSEINSSLIENDLLKRPGV